MWQMAATSPNPFAAAAVRSGTEAKGMDEPSFTEIANRPMTTTESLAAVIQTRHPKMSPGATRGPSEAADLAAYILTLKQQK